MSHSARKLPSWLYFYLEREGGALRGSRAPSRLACESPIAIACFRLVTFFPDAPLRNVPRLCSRKAFATFS